MPPTAADSILAATSLAGCLAAMVVIRARSTPDGLATRFLFAFALIAGILLTRLLDWHLHAHFFDFIGRVFAAWIPLAALLVLEGLQRRHAPRPVKIGALAGGIVCTLVAFFDPALGFPNYILLAVQGVSLVVIYWLAFTSSGEGMTQSELRALARLRFAIPILVVCLASDYGVFGEWVPLRGSSVAILFLCWVAIGAAQATASAWDAAIVLAVVTVVAVLVGLAGGALTGNWHLGVQIGAMALAAAILALVVNEAIRAFASSRRDDVLRALGQAGLGDVRRFMADVTEHSQLQGTTLIEGEELADFDGQQLAAAFAMTPVMDCRDIAQLPDEARQQLESLFTTYDATHLLLVSVQPLRIAAATLAAVGSNAALKTELALVQRMAMLVSQQEARADGAQ
jgi:hypothetical protein